jgi:hypothetical protein
VSKVVLVHGCSRGAYDPYCSADSLRAINISLSWADRPPIAVADFSAVQIATLLDGEDHKSRLLHLPWAARQIRNFITSAGLRTRAAENVASAIGDETKIVIAHSLGSVAAYEALCLLSGHNVHHFITLGSPLAMPHCIRGRLAAFSAHGRHAWPRTVEHWLNLFNRRDPVALYRLRSHFGDGYRIDDRPVRLPLGRPHQLVSYLKSQDFVTALGCALLSEVACPTAGRHGA